MNKTILIGRLTKDPELATTVSGQSVCNFSIAVSRNFKNQNGERETDFINIVCWGAIAENSNKYLKKGRQAAIYGRIQVRQYEGNDGVKRTAFEVVAEEVEFLSNTNKEDETSNQTETKPKHVQVENDSLPF